MGVHGVYTPLPQQGRRRAQQVFRHALAAEIGTGIDHQQRGGAARAGEDAFADGLAVPVKTQSHEVLLLLPQLQVIPCQGLDALDVHPVQESVLACFVLKRNGGEFQAHWGLRDPGGRQETEHILSIVVAQAAGFIKPDHFQIIRRNLGIQPGGQIRILGFQLISAGQQRAEHQRPG